MKLIHCADIHLDSALATSLTRQEARRRNDELFETFIKMMDYAQREKVRAVLVAGDLFDSENGREAVRKRILEAVAAHPQRQQKIPQHTVFRILIWKYRFRPS